MDYKQSSHGCGALRLSLLATTIMAALMPAAQAVEIDTDSEDWSVRFDNTGKFNYGMRTESADDRMLATPNNNDGDYNFKDSGDTVATRFDLLTELDVVNQGNKGFRISAASWYDYAYNDVGADDNPFINGNSASSGIVGLPPVAGNRHLSDYADRYYHGPSGELLDAFVFFSSEVGDESLVSVKVGQHNLYWGETLLNPVHSMSYGQSGLDLAKLAASPGTEAKELFVPRNQISASFTLNPELTFAAQYFLEWDAARLPEAGTYYGSSDLVGFGAQSFLLGHTGGPGLAGPSGTLSNIRRGEDIEPGKHGDWGIMAKWSPEALDGTLGAFYRRTADILPQAVLDARGLSVRGATANPILNLRNSISTTSYSLAYGEDIDIFGLSLSKDVAGVSVGSDLNYRHNMPLSSIPALLSASGPGGLAAGLGALPPRHDSTGVITDDSDGYSATGETLHWTLNGLMTIADTPLFDAAALLGELYYSNLLDLNDHNKALYKGEDSYTGIDKPTTDNWGLAVNFTPIWYQVLPGVDMSMPLSVNWGLAGISPVQAGGAKDTGNYAVGLGATIYNQYFVDLKYVDSFGKSADCNDGGTDGSTPNALDATQRNTCYAGGYSSFSGGGATTEDRGAIYLTLKTSY
ncbi:Protein of uncharacterised function (DUF1302) [Aeromonas encheleia]|uniref:DUF1302 domain-containing protein n=1 Tax=Aeromonas encheleia TaxID=73010 RepID=A0AAE9SE15_9GAMM|nr:MULTISPECIES: DUF1302 domain-containing protein [Aeromonas]UNP89851.1 DUF1302 domain-containing protein [Aeromonas encheleia]USV59046.1 DUF1302 domain-containing protein [Aeromonas encheleia]VEG96903.1 Protein of uncharacterised function (DUF1302) [Aeromonas encheleia]